MPKKVQYIVDNKININYNFRKAPWEDREEMLQISYDLGQDYLPRVIDKWMSVEKGGFYLIEDRDNDCIVGYSILKFPLSDQVWMAGRRVRPDYHNLGAGSVLTGFLAEQAREEGAECARLATTFDNYPAQKVAEKYNFYKQSRWRVFFNQEFTHEIKNDLPNVTWLGFDEEMYQKGLTGEFEKDLRHGRRMLFTTDFSFLGLTDSEYHQISDNQPNMIKVGDSEPVLFLGHDARSKEGEPLFAINRIMFLNDNLADSEYTIRDDVADQFPFDQIIKSLLVDLESRGYWGFNIAFPYDLWEQYYQELSQFFPVEEGNSFYVMERNFDGQ